MDQVYDYQAMKADGSVKRGSPRMLHRTDCQHQAPTTVFRRATAAEQRSLPECTDCAWREGREWVNA